MRLTYIGAGIGVGIGVGIGATTRCCNCLIISGRCAGCHLRSPFRLKRAHAHERRASSCGQTAGHCIKKRKASKDGRHQNGLYGAGCQPLDKLGFRQPPSGSCTVQSFSVPLHRHSALRPSTTWLSLTSTSAPQTYRRKWLLF